jgi:poly(3-hydroxybutyrate) depolymerase
VQHDITVDVAAAYQPAYTSREYHTYLPENYDPNTAYPLYFWGNGCGVTQGNPEGIPAANVAETQTGAILVFMIQEDGCFDAGKGGLADTPDIPYFETMLNDIEANYCIDRGKIFVGGYSSTAWFAATLSCSHGHRINGIGMAAGGQQDELPVCTGPAALILWAGNEGCTGNPIDTCPGEAWEGSGAVRDRLISENGCNPDPNAATQWDTNSAWSSCELYANCGKNPVVFCPHGGGHDTGGGSQMNSEGFWKLFKQTW